MALGAKSIVVLALKLLFQLTLVTQVTQVTQVTRVTRVTRVTQVTQGGGTVCFFHGWQYVKGLLCWGAWGKGNTLLYLNAISKNHG